MNKKMSNREGAVLEETTNIKEEKVKAKHSRRGNSMCQSPETGAHTQNKNKIR